MATKQLLEVSTSGKWESNMKTLISIRDFAPFLVDEPKNLGGTDTGPNPVEFVLAALSSCTSVVIALIAKELNFTYKGVEFENKGTVDLQGLMGVESVSPHFESVTFNVYFDTDESQTRIEELKDHVERRCPVYNLIKDAGVEIQSNWYKNK